MSTVVLVGTLDTKGTETAFVRDRLLAHGVEVLVIDVGVLGEPAFEADVSPSEVASAGGAEFADLVGTLDRGAAITAMAEGAAAVVAALHEQGRVDGAMALGGSGGTSIAARAFRSLPLGMPKVVVSTVASGDTRAYVAETDLILVPSVVDIAGLNRISTRILANAAAAIAGMVGATQVAATENRPLIGASMFGVTTPCVTAARTELEQLGYEVLVFHMTGAGGRTLESLTEQGLFAGILDVTTTELADELVGGVFGAGPRRLTGAARRGIPQVVSVGALDMVNFGPIDTVPTPFADRNLYVHNPSMTLMRTTPAECAELGARLADRLSSAAAPTTVLLPLRGVSAIAGEGGPFFDPVADRALFDAIRLGLTNSDVGLVEIDTDVNDPRFAHALADTLHEHIASGQPVSG